MNNLPTLLKREYWENRGGFFYTPIIIGAFLLITLLIGLFNTDHLIETHADDPELPDLMAKAGFDTVFPIFYFFKFMRNVSRRYRG